MLLNPTSWIRLKFTVQLKLTLHLCGSFLMNNHNLNANSVENQCFVALNVKLQIKVGFKTCY